MYQKSLSSEHTLCLDSSLMAHSGQTKGWGRFRFTATRRRKAFQTMAFLFRGIFQPLRPPSDSEMPNWLTGPHKHSDCSAFPQIWTEEQWGCCHVLSRLSKKFIYLSWLFKSLLDAVFHFSRLQDVTRVYKNQTGSHWYDIHSVQEYQDLNGDGMWQLWPHGSQFGHNTESWAVKKIPSINFFSLSQIPKPTYHIGPRLWWRFGVRTCPATSGVCATWKGAMGSSLSLTCLWWICSSYNALILWGTGQAAAAGNAHWPQWEEPRSEKVMSKETRRRGISGQSPKPNMDNVTDYRTPVQQNIKLKSRDETTNYITSEF